MPTEPDDTQPPAPTPTPAPVPSAPTDSRYFEIEIGPNALALGLAYLKLERDLAMSEYRDKLKQLRSIIDDEKAQGATLKADRDAQKARADTLQAKLDADGLDDAEKAEIDGMITDAPGIVDDAPGEVAPPDPNAPPVG